MTSSPRRYLGSWPLPSGNARDVYLDGAPNDGVFDVHCEWDTPPSPAWSDVDVAHYELVVAPAISRATATALGLPGPSLRVDV